MNKRLLRLLSMLLIVGLCISNVYVPLKAAGKTSSTSKSIKLSKSSLTLTVGESQKIKVKNTKETVIWSSSNKKIASVSQKGKIKAKKVGTCQITATIGNKKLYCTVTVKNATKNSAFNSSFYLGGITFPYNSSWIQGSGQEDEISTVSFIYNGLAIIYGTVKVTPEICDNYSSSTESFYDLLEVLRANFLYDCSNVKFEVEEKSGLLGKITGDLSDNSLGDCSIICYIRVQKDIIIFVEGIAIGQSISKTADTLIHDICTDSEYGNVNNLKPLLAATPTPTPTPTPSTAKLDISAITNGINLTTGEKGQYWFTKPTETKVTFHEADYNLKQYQNPSINVFTINYSVSCDYLIESATPYYKQIEYWFKYTVYDKDDYIVETGTFHLPSMYIGGKAKGSFEATISGKYGTDFRIVISADNAY